MARRRTPAQKLRALLERHELPQVHAAHVLGVAPRTVRRWLAPPGVPSWRECPAWVPELLEVRLLKQK